MKYDYQGNLRLGVQMDLVIMNWQKGVEFKIGSIFLNEMIRI